MEDHLEAEPPGVLPGQGQGLGVYFRGVDLRLGEMGLQGQGDGPAPRAHVQDARRPGEGKP
ncbi:hypothetical protein YIM1640_21120 [Thermus oshimai]